MLSKLSKKLGIFSDIINQVEITNYIYDLICPVIIYMYYY